MSRLRPRCAIHGNELYSGDLSKIYVRLDIHASGEAFSDRRRDGENQRSEIGAQPVGSSLTSCGVKRVELPDLIIAATSRSSDSAAPMERFHNAAPLLRLVVSTGTFTSEASM